MHLIIIQLQRQSPPVFCRFPNVKTLAQSMFPTRRSHNDTRTNAYNVSSFNRLLRSLFTQSCFRKATFTYSCACQADSEVAVNANLELRSQNCKSYWNLEVSARVPRFGHLLWCLYLQIEAIVFCDKQFSERPSLWLVKTLWSTVLWSAQRKKQNLNYFGSQNGIWQVLLKTWIMNTDIDQLCPNTSPDTAKPNEGPQIKGELNTSAVWAWRGHRVGRNKSIPNETELAMVVGPTTRNPN